MRWGVFPWRAVPSDNSEMADDTEEARLRRLSLFGVPGPDESGRDARSSAAADFEYFTEAEWAGMRAIEKEGRTRKEEEEHAKHIEDRGYVQNVNGNLFYYRRLRWYESTRFWLVVAVLLTMIGGAVWLAAS
ncbi:hypothetical protein APR04_004097 [Promicromonospora umidemergens]|nr:hypothetical protein [Promicromonospora umidemergens]